MQKHISRFSKVLENRPSFDQYGVCWACDVSIVPNTSFECVNCILYFCILLSVKELHTLTHSKHCLVQENVIWNKPLLFPMITVDDIYIV